MSIKSFLFEIREQVRNVRTKGSFVRNVSIVLSGNVLNFLIRMLLTPVISRLFGPEAYGEYAFYNLIITNVGFALSLSLPSVYIIPKPRMAYLALGKLVLAIILAGNVLLFLVFLALEGLRFTNLQISALNWFLITLLIILGALNAILSASNTRAKRFQKNTSISVVSNLISRSSVVGIGYYGIASGTGLIIGDLIRGSFQFLKQTPFVVKLALFRFLSVNNWRYVFSVFREYRDIPKFVFPSRLLSKLTAGLPILVLGLHYGTKELGSYTFALTIVSIPIQLFENSIRPVLFQKASSIREDIQDLRSVFMKSFRFTAIFSSISTYILATLSVMIFPFVFGQEWNEAGEIVVYLSIQILSQAIIAPYVDFWRVMRREKQLLRINSIAVAVRVIPLSLVMWNVELYDLLILLAIFHAMSNFIILADLIYHLYKAPRTIIFIIIAVVLLLSCYFLLLSSF